MKVLRVRHAGGHDTFETGSFNVDDKSGVLIVYEDQQKRKALAAFNAEFWIAADFVDSGTLVDDREEVDDDGRSEIRTEAERVLRGS